VHRWKVFSTRGKISTLKDYLIGKLLWEELTLQEKNLLWIIPGVFKNPILIEIFRFLNEGGEKKHLRKILEVLNLFGFFTPTRNHYLSLKSQLRFFLIKEESPLGRTKPYSGYTKHYKDHGSLAPERAELFSNSSDEDYLFNEDILLDKIFSLSQEYLSLLKRVGLTLADDANKQKQRILFLITSNSKLW
jgi:hypothetical protein